MNLAEKMKHLREVEGDMRGFNRPMTQMEVVKAMQEELHESLSQAYLSQLESGKRVHLTASSRVLLANFFKVHPGYLVSDPPDYSTDLLTNMEEDTDRFSNWLGASAVEWQADPTIFLFLQHLGSVEDPRQYLTFFEQLLDFPIDDLERIFAAYLLPQENAVD